MSTLVWEAALWAALALSAPTAASWLWPRLRPRLGEWGSAAEALGPWLHGLLPAYLALVTGAVSGRDAGLFDHSWGDWASGVLACGAGLVAAAILAWWRPLPLRIPSPLDGALDEPRWALYRGAGALWAGAWTPGVFIGLGLAVLEWMAVVQPWRRRSSSEATLAGRRWRILGGLAPEEWGILFRMALSAALFLATRNLWLTAATQAGVLALLRPRLSSRSDSSSLAATSTFEDAGGD